MVPSYPPSEVARKTGPWEREGFAAHGRGVHRRYAATPTSSQRADSGAVSPCVPSPSGLPTRRSSPRTGEHPPDTRDEPRTRSSACGPDAAMHPARTARPARRTRTERARPSSGHRRTLTSRTPLHSTSSPSCDHTHMPLRVQTVRQPIIGLRVTDHAVFQLRCTPDRRSAT